MAFLGDGYRGCLERVRTFFWVSGVGKEGGWCGNGYIKEGAAGLIWGIKRFWILLRLYYILGLGFAWLAIYWNISFSASFIEGKEYIIYFTSRL